MRKELVAVLLAALLVNNALAQGHAGQQSDKGAQAQKPTANLRTPTGPSGFGVLRLGMTKETIEALQASDGIYLAGALAAEESKNPLPEGTLKFVAPVNTPLDKNPINIIFTFTSAQLSALAFSLEDAHLDKVKKQISEKYGPGKVADTRKEEQCIYRNGNSFTITSGTLKTSWFEPVSSIDQIETEVSEVSLNFCPSNLRDGAIRGLKMQGISIRKVATSETAKSQSLF